MIEIEQGSLLIKRPLVDMMFRDMHSINGGAGFIGLKAVQTLAYAVEAVLGMIHSNDLTPDSGVISKLSRGVDTLITLFHDLDQDTFTDSSDVLSDLQRIVGMKKV